jgi:hypothetical protein
VRGSGLDAVRGRRSPRLLLLLVSAAALGLAVSACGGGGLSLARQACVHVNASLRLYDRSLHNSNAAAAARERTRAIEQLEAALPLAARATSTDPQWNPLMTTLEEIGRNSEANLVRALRSQCELADSSGEQAPVVNPSTPANTGRPTPSTLPGQ